MHQFFASTSVTPQFSSFPLPFEPNSYDFSIKPQSSSCGSAFEMNSEGRVVGAAYASGAVVKIQETFMLIRAADCSLWFADCQKNFHPID
jgi:hypothetical protein